MSWKKAAVIIVIVIALLIVFPIVLIFGRFFAASLPKQKGKAVNAAEEYLEEKYVQKMVYADSHLSLEPYLYNITFYPESEPELKFTVLVYTDFSVYLDNYFTRYFEFYTENLVQKATPNIWGEELQVYVHVSNAGGYKSIIPAEINEKMTAEEMEPYFKYYFSMTPHRVLNSDSKKEETEKIFKLIQALQKSPHHPEEILIWYFTGKDKYGEITTNPETWTEEYLEFDDWENITTIDQVIAEMDRQWFKTKE